MSRFAVVALLSPFLLIACTSPHPPSQSSALSQCGGAGTPIYTGRFAAQAGGSGVATGEDAVAGKINSDSSGSGGSAPGSGDGTAKPSAGPTGAGGESGGGTSDSPDAPPSTPGSTPGSAPPSTTPAMLTAMVVTCGPTPCPDGLVAVEPPPVPGGFGGGAAGGSGGPTTGVPTTAGAGGSESGGKPSSSGTDDSSAPASPPAPPAGQPSPTLLCVQPPPECPAGQSPQFTARAEWECTDCSYVVTYGGIYGNYRRCVSAPTLQCQSGQVPTWVYEDDQWECRDTCDNGQYDKHTIGSMLVCVPC